MTRIAYTVTATLPDAPTADAYIEWLQDGHIDAVIAGGAHSAMVVRLDPAPAAPIQVEVRYIFSTRENFDRYVQLHAPALRAEGLKRFGSTPGISFSRRTGTVV
jgi:hypothetical protein